MADFIKTLWSDKIIQALYEDVDLNMLFDRSLESYARSQGGNKIVLPTLSAGGAIKRTDNLTVGAGLPLALNDLGKGGLELSIYEYTYGPIVVRKLDDIQSNLPLLQKNTEEVTASFKQFILSTWYAHLISTVNAAHKINWSGGEAGEKFCFDDLRAIRKLFIDTKSPLDNLFLSLSSDAEKDLFSDDYLKNWFAVNQAAIQSGKLPQLAGVGVITSPSIPLTTAAGAIDANPVNNTKLNVAAWRKNFANLVIQTEMEIITKDDPQYLGTVVSFTNRFGFLLERDKGAVLCTQK